jgi:hypothetical protein
MSGTHVQSSAQLRAEAVRLGAAATTNREELGYNGGTMKAWPVDQPATYSLFTERAISVNKVIAYSQFGS